MEALQQGIAYGQTSNQPNSDFLLQIIVEANVLQGEGENKESRVIFICQHKDNT